MQSPGACKHEEETKHAGRGGAKGVFRHHSNQRCSLWCLFYSSAADLSVHHERLALCTVVSRCCLDPEEEGLTMQYCSTHCRSNAMQFAADQRGRRRGRLATFGSMQCLFESSDPSVGIVVLKLKVPLRIELLKW